MQLRRVDAIFATIVFTCAIQSVLATSTYQYDKDEYVIIKDGMAPNKLYSLASHGSGELGNEGFHVYLMTESAHKTIAPLEAIGQNTILDSDPEAYHAAWSPDSRHVAVHFRSDRHILAMLLYEIRNRRPHLLNAPPLLPVVAKHVDSSDDNRLLLNSLALTWTGATSCKLQERRRYRAGTPALAQALGKYGRRRDPDVGSTGTGEYLIDFSAEAVCKLVPGRGYRIVSVKPGPFEQAN